MAKIVGYIPARLGSQRVIKKNLRLIAGKPLISYIIEAAKASGCFSELYINSEAEIFGEVAREYGVGFYKRPAHLSTNEANNDAFAHDFIQNVPGDICVQLLPTSPLILPEEIREFVRAIETDGLDTLVSVVDHRIACLYQGKPINFSTLEQHRSSQTMTPVQSYATVLMAWRHQSFLRTMREHGCGYHGGDSRIGYFPLGGLTAIDVDTEEDFALAEVALQYRQNQGVYEKRYWEPLNTKGHAETDVPTILVRDGVMQTDFAHENLPLTHIRDVIASKDSSKSWCHRIVNTENNSCTLISQLPGEGNRRHYHPAWNEWWYIVAGTWKWEIDGKEMFVNEGDVVFIPKTRIHKITAVGDRPAIRLAVSREGVPHVYPEG